MTVSICEHIICKNKNKL